MRGRPHGSNSAQTLYFNGHVWASHTAQNQKRGNVAGFTGGEPARIFALTLVFRREVRRAHGGEFLHIFCLEALDSVGSIIVHRSEYSARSSRFLSIEGVKLVQGAEVALKRRFRILVLDALLEFAPKLVCIFWGRQHHHVVDVDENRSASPSVRVGAASASNGRPSNVVNDVIEASFSKGSNLGMPVKSLQQPAVRAIIFRDWSTRAVFWSASRSPLASHRLGALEKGIEALQCGHSEGGPRGCKARGRVARLLEEI